jgi:tetratricopeptide (TPR) repeat protein
MRTDRTSGFAIHGLLCLLLLVTAFSLATILQPRAAAWGGSGGSNSVLKVLFGDGRRLFADHFFVKADISFHSGYYPSIFDQAQAPKNSRHMTSEEGSAEEEAHERAMNFLGPPRDVLERFGRHFMITEHTHLHGGKEREILPWLKLSADLDPQRIDTYTVAAYWLRVRLGKVAEAEQFLREGLRANPKSPDLLFELGRLYFDNYKDTGHARNLWELALRRWQEQEAGKKEPDAFLLEEITSNLGYLEEQAGNLNRAIGYLEMARKVSPNPAAVQRQIDVLRQKVGQGRGAGPAQTPK